MSRFDIVDFILEIVLFIVLLWNIYNAREKQGLYRNT